jgi:hypothetical protein
VARDGRGLRLTDSGLKTLLLGLILRFQAHASLSPSGRVLEISQGLALCKASLGHL